jgi:transketolase N-terminal domain/subunit
MKVSWVVAGGVCSLAAISQTTTHMQQHGHHAATMGLRLAGMSLGRGLRALALSHTASVRCSVAPA